MADSKYPSGKDAYSSKKSRYTIGDNTIKSIANDLLKNGRRGLAKHKEAIPSETYRKVMDTNDNELFTLLKENFEEKWETQYGASNPWFVAFLQQYKNGTNPDVYGRVLTRTAEHGNMYMKNCPILSIVLQLLFDGIDDDCLKETDVFDNLWFTITNGGLKSITEYSDYIAPKLLNKQLKSQSILFQALREYYRENVFLSLRQSNIPDKENLYESVLNKVADGGWSADMKSIKDYVAPKSYEKLREKLHSFDQEQQSLATGKPKAAGVRPTQAASKPERSSTERKPPASDKPKTAGLRPAQDDSKPGRTSTEREPSASPIPKAAGVRPKQADSKPERASTERKPTANDKPKAASVRPTQADSKQKPASTDSDGSIEKSEEEDEGELDPSEEEEGDNKKKEEEAKKKKEEEAKKKKEEEAKKKKDEEAKKKKEPTSSFAPRAGFTDVQNACQIEALKLHNTLRARHGVPDLILDDDISRKAQAYAEDLTKIGRLQHSKNRNDLGENLYYWSSSPAPGKTGHGTKATQDWYDEINDYNFNRPGFSSGTGHFTQVVWKSSKKLGVGIGFANGGQDVFVVAQYGPAGNIMGAFPENVPPPRKS